MAFWPGPRQQASSAASLFLHEKRCRRFKGISAKTMLVSASCQIGPARPQARSQHLSPAVDTLNRSEFRILSPPAVR
jgi:hypothetical protein